MLAAKLTKYYRINKSGHAFDVIHINDNALIFIIHLLEGRVLRKYRKNEMPAMAVKLVENTKEGKVYNWCLYLLNEFIEECASTQEHNHQFHYSWMPVLITLVSWK